MKMNSEVPEVHSFPGNTVSSIRQIKCLRLRGFAVFRREKFIRLYYKAIGKKLLIELGYELSGNYKIIVPTNIYTSRSSCS